MVIDIIILQINNCNSDSLQFVKLSGYKKNQRIKCNSILSIENAKKKLVI